MPRIDAPTLAEHRDQRLSALLSAGRSLLLEEGPTGVTMAAVANRTGLSRPAIYEYFDSTADFLAAILLDHMREWTRTVGDAIAAILDPSARIDAYVVRSIHFFHQDDHRAMVNISQATLPSIVQDRIASEHRSMIHPLVTALTELGIQHPTRAAQFVQGVVEAAARQVSADLELETQAAVRFIRAGLANLNQEA
jgi:AcrR family transcriptional regulator